MLPLHQPAKIMASRQGIEPCRHSFGGRTAALALRLEIWSEKGESNPQPPTWKDGALPVELFSRKFGVGRWIRTTDSHGFNMQLYQTELSPQSF